MPLPRLSAVIDIRLVREDAASVKAALGRRGVAASVIDELHALDVHHRQLLQVAETLQAEVKELSRQVGEARRSGDTDRAEALTAASRATGERQTAAKADAEAVGDQVRALLYRIPNLPDAETPDGRDETDNVVVREWWPEGHDRTFAEWQRTPHWDIGEDLGYLDFTTAAKLSGSMFALYRGDGSRLLRALGAFALDAHADAYEEIRPPHLVLTETMLSTGHLPKSEEDMYGVERDGLWAIPTAEVPLTSMHRGDLLEESALPIRLTAQTACFRREAGAAGRDTRGLLRLHEFDKVELFAYCTPEQMRAEHAEILRRAEGLLQALALPYRVLDLCAGDLGSSSARTVDLEVYSPGVDRWLEVSSVSWFTEYQARRAAVRYRPADGSAPRLVCTVNGSALAWARIWAVLVEHYRQADGTVAVPSVLRPYLGGRHTLTANYASKR
jgi:seryl-tRNA synthetase